MFINAQIILPLVYNLPVAIYLFVTKRLLFRGVLFQLGAPFIWLGLAAAVGFFFPNVAGWIYNNEALNLGSVAGTAGMLWRAFLTSRGRAEMWADFCESTYDRYGIEQQF